MDRMQTVTRLLMQDLLLLLHDLTIDAPESVFVLDSPRSTT